MMTPAPRRYAFRIVDVFAEARFGGNQLGVLVDARGLYDREMQAIARELNFAETTFVLPPADPARTARVRIFTPAAEMPFAGHPTIGTAAVLAEMGRGEELVLEEKIGPVAVRARRKEGASDACWHARLSLPGAVEVPAEKPDVADVARALSLPQGAVVEAWFAAVGPRFCFARLASRETVDVAMLDRAAWQKGLAGSWASQVYLFAGETAKSGDVYSRMLAPGLGVDEDAATGSAAASLVGSLAARASFGGDELRLRITQGVAFGRPSALEAVAEKRGGRVQAIHVAGHVVFVAEGTMVV